MVRSDYSTLLSTHKDTCGQFGDPGTGALPRNWLGRATKVSGYEQRVQEERLMRLGLFRLEKGRQRGKLIALLHYLRRNNPEDQDILFSEGDSERATENRHKLQHRKFQLDTS